ncbi:hypothetical protein L7F22_013295 [Adiantum nelumboides]|nr:hypothetical protein [Adiantum nelumboides]
MEDTDMEEDLDENMEEDFEEALEEIRNTQQVEEGAPQEQAISKSHIELLNSGSTHPLDQEILSAFTPSRNIQPVHLLLLCDIGDIAEKLYDLNNKDRFGDMDPGRVLHGAQLIWADFPTCAAVSCTSPLVPTWNEMKLDLIKAATTLAEEYLLDNGTFVATLQGEDLSDVVNICGDAGFALKRVLYLDICGEFWRFDDDSDLEIIDVMVIAIFNFVQRSTWRRMERDPIRSMDKANILAKENGCGMAWKRVDKDIETSTDGESNLSKKDDMDIAQNKESEVLDSSMEDKQEAEISMDQNKQEKIKDKENLEQTVCRDGQKRDGPKDGTKMVAVTMQDDLAAENIEEQVATRVEVVQSPPPRFENALEEIREKIEKRQEPLPVPDFNPKKKHGSCRLKKMKERYALTEVQKLVSQMQFVIAEESLLGDGLGHGYGMLGQTGSGKLRVTRGLQKLGGKAAKALRDSSTYGSSISGASSTSGMLSSFVFTPVQSIKLANSHSYAAAHFMGSGVLLCK